MKAKLYHVNGNRILITDGLPDDIQALADKHKGIGFDQLYIECDDKFYNSDGSTNTMCVNGLLCVVKIILLDAPYNKETGDYMVVSDWGEQKAYVCGNHKTGKFSLTTKYKTLPDGIIQIGENGNLHKVVIDVYPSDKKLPEIPKNIKHNITLFGFMENDAYHARTFELGADETQSCGSGACALGVYLGEGKHEIHHPGGMSTVEVDTENQTVTYTATPVLICEIEID